MNEKEKFTQSERKDDKVRVSVGDKLTDLNLGAFLHLLGIQTWAPDKREKMS